MMLADVPVPHEDIIDVGTISGGGADGAWAWTATNELADSGYPFEMVGGSSTGCLVAFLIYKGYREEGDRLYKLTYEEGARNIFEPGIGQIKNGKFDVRWLQLVPKVFGLRKVKSLMTQDGLYETLLKLEKRKPGGVLDDMFWNTTSLATAIGTQHAASQYKGKPEEMCRALTASTAMPVILPWWDLEGFKTSMDGGITDGLPFGQMFDRMQPSKAYRFWNIMCNPMDMVPMEDLQNIFQIAGRTLDIVLNAAMVAKLKRTQDKNDVAKVIWPIADEIEAAGLPDIANRLRAQLGYKYMPIHNIINPSGRGVVDFTVEAYNEHVSTAKKQVAAYISALTNPGGI
jgi:predicted acylesterase/phospholipase RssA